MHYKTCSSSTQADRTHAAFNCSSAGLLITWPAMLQRLCSALQQQQQQQLSKLPMHLLLGALRKLWELLQRQLGQCTSSVARIALRAGVSTLLEV